ncbi:MAG TPA: radical SAM protein, partial [Polyangiaceae bacterium]|nr:radical SAM protein [Polyangiaceae bacterium]
VTACKNENEVPWGINRRRVVTLNDGKAGERSVSMACMHCTDAPCQAVCPVSCFYTTDDAVVLHDGEHALDLWLRHVLMGDPEPSHPNVWLRDSNRYRRTSFGACPQVDLDSLPIPMWIADGLRLDDYLVPQYPIALPLSRGCYWGRCVFCNISSQTSSSYRRRSVANAIADIKAAMAETGSRWFDFPVDSFRPKHLRELALAIVQEGLSIEWGAEVLLDRGFNDEVLADLARSGCRCLRFGMESACPQTLRAMNKPVQPQTARRVLGSCRKHGIRTAVMFIVGFPSETQAQIQQTYDFVVDNRDRIDFLTFHTYSLVLGSPMAEDPGKYGLYLKPGRAIFSPNLPFVNTNPGGMQEDHVAQIVEPMRESLREFFPDLGELWTVGIGGWMTFANCCEAPPAEPPVAQS